MKIAVCVSGAFKNGNSNTSIIRNNEIQKNKFPTADFYYATWDTYKNDFEKIFPDEKCEYFPEIEMIYHPYLDIPKADHISPFYQDTANFMIKDKTGKRLEWSSHHTKQILIHFWLADTIKDEYDVVVRTRFDGYIAKTADFLEYLEDTFKNHRANCFGATKKQKFEELNEFDSSFGKKHHMWILDQLIIHNASIVDVERVNQLHTEKKLHAAETGWYQVLSMPFGSNKHRDHDGWANHDKNVLTEFFY